MNHKHGMSDTSTYNSWHSMLQRCENPNYPEYKYWGGRGIRVCVHWHDFQNFFADMGIRPNGLTLDRKNNDGNYEPGNCRWATIQEQRVNSRSASHGPQKQSWFRAWYKDMMCQFLSNNQHEFARQHNLNQRHISECLCGIHKTHKSWTFVSTKVLNGQ